MKKNFAKKMELESLDELIGKCEESMISPFKKKKPEVEVAVLSEEDDDAEHETENMPGPDAGSGLSPEDLEQLFEMYTNMKRD